MTDWWFLKLKLSRFFALDVDTSVVLPSSYDPVLVALSFFVATLAGFAFIHLLHRIAEHQGTTARFVWMAGGALIMGFGIWAMHFVGMLAYRLPVEVTYDPRITLASVLPAILASAWNLQIVAHAHVSRRRLMLGGLVLGSGIGLMHYTGMAAVEFDAYIRYDPALFVLSIVVAVALAMLALWVAFTMSRHGTVYTLAGEAVSALLIGLAVSGMHYTAMNSTVCLVRTGQTTHVPILDSDVLAGATAVVASLILIAGIAAVVFDRRLASEKSRREEATHRARATGRRLRLIMDNVADAVITLDDAGIVETCNRSAERIFGMPARNIAGRALHDLIADDGTDQTRRRLRQYFENPATRSAGGDHFEIVGRHDDGSIVFVEAVLSEVEEDGRPLIIGALRDVTDRTVATLALAQAKDDAEKANQAKSEFISHMSHELRTPLNAVIGLADLLLEVEAMRADPARVVEYLTDIRSSGTHLLSLVNDILDVSVVESGRRSLQAETFDAREVIESMIHPLRSTLEGTGANLSIAVGGNPAPIRADRQSFHQVLLNLAGNAIKHGGENVNVEIRIEADSAGEFVKISVIDDGPGMAPEMVQAIGQPFPQARPSYHATAPKHKGAGLGLYIVNRLIALNGGRFTLNSQPDQGTTATTSWPRAVYTVSANNAKA
jgi:PAS domain S-box-containing protein